MAGFNTMPAWAMHLTNPLVVITLGVWISFELVSRIREALRGKGSTAADRGTRLLIAFTLSPTFWLVVVVARRTRNDHSLWLPGRGGVALLVIGLVVLVGGLALRIWAIVSLGESFRTTVEIDEGQPLVDTGPYRWLRHPSYTGLLLIVLGWAIEGGAWPALVLAAFLPLIGFVRRIQIEEQALTSAMGDAYREYSARTKRLVPGIW